MLTTDSPSLISVKLDVTVMAVSLQTLSSGRLLKMVLSQSQIHALSQVPQPALPLVIVADAAFPLKENMLRPYPGKNLSEDKAIFNYRLSRARRIIENSIGILAARWRLFRRPIISDPNKVISYAKAAIALHNYLRTTESAVYCPPGFIDGEDGSGNIVDGSWRQDNDPSSGLEPLTSVGSNRSVRQQLTSQDLLSVSLYVGTQDLLLTCGICTKPSSTAQLEKSLGSTTTCEEHEL